MGQFGAISYDEMVRQMTEPAFPYAIPGQLSRSVARLRVEHLSHDALLTIIDKIGTAVGQVPLQTNGEEAERLIRSQAALSFLLMSYVRNASVTFPAEAIEKVRLFRRSEVARVRELEEKNIGKLIVLDERNKQGSRYLGIKEQAREEILRELSSSRQEDGQDVEQRLQAFTLASGKDATREIMYQFLDGHQELPGFFYKVFANTLDFDTLRTNLRNYMKLHPESKQRLDILSTSLGLDLGETVLDLADFYRNEPLDEHRPYSELLVKDLAILSQEFQGRKKVIDVGCGKGRLMLPLRREGIPVEGIDAVAEYGDYIKSRDPQAVFYQGLMDALPFANGGVDGIFIMGRTSGHWKNMRDGIKTLREFRRVLAPNGSVILDLPDITAGEYRKHTIRQAKVLERAGIWNHEFGDINDSPNGIHYFDRLMPGIGQMKAMALLAGLKAEIIDKVPFAVGEDKEDINIYWRLTHREGGEIRADTHPMDTTYDEVRTLLTFLSPADLEEFGIHVTESGNPSLRGVMLNVEDY